MKNMKRVLARLALMTMLALTITTVCYANEDEQEPQAAEVTAQETSEVTAQSITNQALNTLDGLNPYIFVAGYEIIDGVVESGETFTLRAYIANANTTTDAYNIMATLYFSGDEGFYLPTGTVNQYYLPMIGGGQTTYIDIPFQVKDTFVVPSVAVEFAFTYSSTNDTHANNTTITVMQYEKTELNLNNVSMPSIIYAGNRSTVSLQASNSGKSQITDIVITIDGDFKDSPIVLEQDVLEVGERFTVDTNFIFENLGESEVTLQVDYLNNRGEEFSIEPQTYAVEVKNTGDTGDSSNIAIEPEVPAEGVFNPSNFWLYIALASLGLIILVIGAIIFELKINNKSISINSVKSQIQIKNSTVKKGE